jgi:hypothetical protein
MSKVTKAQLYREQVLANSKAWSGVRKVKPEHLPDPHGFTSQELLVLLQVFARVRCSKAFLKLMRDQFGVSKRTVYRRAQKAQRK